MRGNENGRGRERLSLLVVSSFGSDTTQLRGMLDEGLWDLLSAGTVQEALALLSGEPVAVVICERDLPDGCWKDLLLRPSPAQAPHLIVISRLADERLWAEVMNMGGFDVIAKPLHEREVAWVMESAWRQRQQRPRIRCAQA
jgi:DNA-binding response OmpR family regulator